MRLNPAMLFATSLVVLLGMWLERFVIIVVSLSRDFLPSSWGSYVATRWDYAVFAGTLGLFFYRDVPVHAADADDHHL